MLCNVEIRSIFTLSYASFVCAHSSFLRFLAEDSEAACGCIRKAYFSAASGYKERPDKCCDKSSFPIRCTDHRTGKVLYEES